MNNIVVIAVMAKLRTSLNNDTGIISTKCYGIAFSTAVSTNNEQLTVGSFGFVETSM